MPPQRSSTQWTHSSSARNAEAKSSPSSTAVDVDSLPSMTRARPDSQSPSDYVFASAPKSLSPTQTSSPPGPPKCMLGSSPASTKLNAAAPPIVNSQALPIHPPLAVCDASTGSPTKRAALERTKVVWMFVGDAPSITRTSPTPPPPLLPESRTFRRSPSPMRAPNACRPYGHPPVAGPSPLRQSSQGRSVEDYDQTNARIRTLNAELLADPRAQPVPRSDLRPPASAPASRALRSDTDRGIGVRYLNVPGAATDALMAVRHRAARRRTSAAGTGIVDISDSESSQFESDDDDGDDDEEEGCESTPPVVPRAGTQTVVEARSDRRASRNNPREWPEQAASTATSPAEHEGRVSAAGPCNSIAHPPPRTDAPGLQWQTFRAGPVIHDRVAGPHRLQPVHPPAFLLNSTPVSTLPSPDPKGKKRARDLDIDGGPWPDGDRANRLAREGKRKKTTPGVSVPVTTPPSRPARTNDNSSRNRHGTSAPRFQE